MTVWINQETGELLEADCPLCETVREQAAEQVTMMERERRADRAARAKAEKAVERDLVARRDGATWNRVYQHWRQAFPELRPTGHSIKSARATKLFMRLEAGATEADVLAAIDAAVVWRYVVYGKRTKTGAKHDLAIDLEDIVAVKRDKDFDFLVAEGYALRT